MAIIRDSTNDSVLLEVDNTYRAIRASIHEHENEGSYRVALVSGTITALAGGAMFFAFRNPSAKLAIVSNVLVGFRSTAGNTATSFIVSMYFTRSYTATETTGIATAPSLKGQTNYHARQMNCLLRIANTGAISGGTGTDNTQPLASAVFSHPGSALSTGLTPVALFQLGGVSNKGIGGYELDTHPVVFAVNEGFRLRADTTALAGTNNFVAYVQVTWTEAASF